MPPDNEDPPAGLSGATATIFLSITLILITYFIFLNAVGHPARHLEDQVAASVRESFHGTAAQTSETQRTEVIADRQQFVKLRNDIEKLTVGFRLGGIEALPDSERIELNLNPDEVFLDDGEIRAKALDAVAGTMAAIAASKLAVRFDITSPLTGDGSERIPDAFKSAGRRTAALIRLFLDRGGVAGKIYGGGRISSDKIPQARITVLLHESPDRPLVRNPKW